MVDLEIPIRIFYFCVRVLIFATIASPVLAQQLETTDQQKLDAQPTPVLTELPDLEVKIQETGAEQHSTLKPVTVQPIIDEQYPKQDLNLGVSRYWIVSSRRALQTAHETNTGSWHLDVYNCEPGVASRTASLQELSQELIPGLPVCLFSHGSFVKWESHCQQANEAFYKLNWATGNQPIQYVFYTWPSDGPYSHIPQVDVAVRGKRAEFNGFHVASLISQIPESCPVTLVGHSHGTRVVLSAMQLAAGGSVQGYSFTRSIGQQRRLRVVLAAGALDHDWLNPGQRYGMALNRVECLLNLRNQNDLPLAFYPLSRPFARRAVARSGITDRDAASIGGYNASKIRQVDVTNLVGSGHYWPDYYGDSQILATLAPYLASF